MRVHVHRLDRSLTTGMWVVWGFLVLPLLLLVALGSGFLSQ